MHQGDRLTQVNYLKISQLESLKVDHVRLIEGICEAKFGNLSSDLLINLILPLKRGPLNRGLTVCTCIEGALLDH